MNALTVPSTDPSTLCVLLAFNTSNQLAVRRAGTKVGPAFVGADESMALARLNVAFPTCTTPVEYFTCHVNTTPYRVFFTQVKETPLDPEVEFQTLERLELPLTQIGVASAVAGLNLTLKSESYKYDVDAGYRHF